VSVASAASAERPDTLVREEIEDRYKWDLSPLYAGWDEWETDLETVRGTIERFADLQGTLALGPDQLVLALQRESEVLAGAEKVHSYAYLRWVEDTRDETVQQRMAQATTLFDGAHAATSWVVPELLAIPEDSVVSWVDEHEALAPFQYPIAEVYRTREHALDVEGERLLAVYEPLNSAVSGLYDAITVTDAEYPEVTLAEGRTLRATGSSHWQSLNRDPLQSDRRVIYEGYIGVFDGRSTTLSALYGTVLQRNWALARARGYESTLEAVLDEHAIPVAVYETLIQTAHEGVEPFRRYHRIRREALSLEHYHDYDRRVPLVEGSASFDYQDIQQPLVDSVAPLGSDYQREVMAFFSGHRVDVYENEGKQPRNFALSGHRFPAFLKLNYGDTMEDAFTLAHEMGHGMHGDRSRRAQPYATFEYATFVAETASLFNEALLNDELLAETKDPELRIGLLQYRIDTIAMAFYEVAILADFERRAHGLAEAGEPVTAEVLQALYLDAYRSVYGDAMDEPELVGNAWATWVHLFFDRPFYVFQYATSLAAATALHTQVTTGPKRERAAAVDRYLELLSAGGSDHPVDLLRRAGVDLTDPTSLQALTEEMTGLVDRLERELAKQKALGR